MKFLLLECYCYQVGMEAHILDPMCGSGTILIEAGMIACNIPANINRKEFAFEKWNDWDNDLFDQIIDSLMKRTKEISLLIIGYDKAPSAVNKAKDNIINANLEDYIKVSQANFFDTEEKLLDHYKWFSIRLMENDWILIWNDFIENLEIL
jgi:putative N6-adenine-specific DNA methylase